MNKIFAFLIIFLIISCNRSENIKYKFHQGDKILWGVYNTNYKSQKTSFMLNKNGECFQYKEPRSYFSETKVYNFNMSYDRSWNVEINGLNIYLRCLLSVFKVININDDYVKLMTNKGDTIYFYKSFCQSDACEIPDEMPKPPF